MAIKPHCVVCGYESDAAGSIAFADYDPRWLPPTRHDGAQILGWSNELGVTAPIGVGLFCERHLRSARRLRRLQSAEALRRLEAKDAITGGLWSRLLSR
jgi:hypothetical protein